MLRNCGELRLEVERGEDDGSERGDDVGDVSLEEVEVEEVPNDRLSLERVVVVSSIPSTSANRVLSMR